MSGKIEPRGLNRCQAAAYVGIGVTKFDAMVTDGRMPKPKVVDRRKIWDKARLDEAFEALPDTSGAPRPRVNWQDVRA